MKYSKNKNENPERSYFLWSDKFKFTRNTNKRNNRISNLSQIPEAPLYRFVPIFQYFIKAVPKSSPQFFENIFEWSFYAEINTQIFLVNLVPYPKNSFLDHILKNLGAAFTFIWLHLVLPLKKHFVPNTGSSGSFRLRNFVFFGNIFKN
jgi:hypothetical protein